jgi:hypothetical protein
MDPKVFPKWLDRYPIVQADHVHDLETRAAIEEFHNKLPRHTAEAKAHDDYKRDQLLDAAAHHLVGMQAARGAGDNDAAAKHGEMYKLTAKALGFDPVGEPPPEVSTRAKNTPSSVYRFKPHHGDAFALPAASE